MYQEPGHVPTTEARIPTTRTCTENQNMHQGPKCVPRTEQEHTPSTGTFIKNRNMYQFRTGTFTKNRNVYQELNRNMHQVPEHSQKPEHISIKNRNIHQEPKPVPRTETYIVPLPTTGTCKEQNQNLYQEPFVVEFIYPPTTRIVH